MSTATTTATAAPTTLPRSGPWTDLGLTLPVFVLYHVGVVFLPVRNAADVVTQQLVALADHDLSTYVGLTCAIGATFVAFFWAAGRGRDLHLDRFAWVALEGVLYAVAMRLVAGYVVGSLPLASAQPLAPVPDRFTGAVMSLGAGLYEEIAFRVLLYGLGLRAILFLFDVKLAANRVSIHLVWLTTTAFLFSAWHHVGPGADPLDLQVFVFRWVCGAVFCLIYRFRGFAPAVWTHFLYDLWVLAI